MQNRSPIVTAMLVIIIIAISFGGGYIFGISRHPDQGAIPVSGNATVQASFSKIKEVWDIINLDYVDRTGLTADNLTRGAIEGMLAALDDPYTSYLDAESFEIGLSGLEGEFDGIGAYVSAEDGRIVIIAPIADSPAEKAGIKAGDTILEVNGEPTEELSLAEVILKIRGPRGTKVTLLVLHEGDLNPVELEITRDTIEVASVRLEMYDRIAHITITQFSERTSDELGDVLREVRQSGANGIVLDLRHNPGGFLATVVDVASQFLTDGVVVQTLSNEGVVREERVNTGLSHTDLPMIVLVDGASASGSEVLAGALQDYNRAVIAGTTTFGKGSVNILRQLEDGSGIYITTGRWLTPAGRLIEGKGIEPDITLDITGDEALQWAIDYLNRG